MSDKFNEQKDILISINKEIRLLQQQVDYLIRNEKPLELLDLDVMMNRTHTIYDMMCGVDLGVAPDEYETDEEEELPVEPETIRSMFGIEEEPEEEEQPQVVEIKESIEEEPSTELEEIGGEPIVNVFVEPDPIEEEPEPIEEDPEPIEEDPEPVEEEEELVEENEDAYFEEEVTDELIPEEEIVLKEDLTPKEEPAPVVEEPKKPELSSDDFGFILNFEPVADSETSFSLGDKLQQEQEPTLADKLQHNTVKSLQSAIGINDKFLFVNELFNGSMEKYNRSIENLDDLKTLNGALIYLNELRVELQWNSSNEAYKRLLELVHRKFEA